MDPERPGKICGSHRKPGYSPMILSTVVLPEEPGRYESLAICLQGVAESVRGQIDYNDLCSALGLSMATVSAGGAGGGFVRYPPAQSAPAGDGRGAVRSG